MKKYLIGLGLFILIVSGEVFGQDPAFTQFYANPLYLNPALAGSHGCARFGLNYRNEWPNLSGNYVTTSAAFDQYFRNISGGIGLLATNDQQGKGTIQTSMIGLLYSYHLKVSRTFTMMFGTRAAWFQKTLDWDRLTFGDMIDARNGFIYSSNDVPRGGKKGYFDASVGMVGFSKHFFFGFAAHHLNQPNETLILGNAKLPVRYTGHVGAEIKFGKKSRYTNETAIMPNVIYQYQKGFQELLLGTYVKHGVFTGGVWFRNRDAFILSAGVSSKNFKLGYSYDVTISRLNNGSSHGSHEVSLGLMLNCKTKPVQFRTISCPSF